MNAVQTVKLHPEWYFRGHRFDTSELISLLVEEVTRGGASVVEVRREGDWVTVSADVDWLGGDVAAFFFPASYQEGGRNSSRVEVVLTAFCDAVVTATRDDFFEVSSSSEAAHHSDELRTMQTNGRVLAFLPPKESRLPDARVLRAEDSPSGALRLVQGEGDERIASAVHSFIRKQNA